MDADDFEDRIESRLRFRRSSRALHPFESRTRSATQPTGGATQLVVSAGRGYDVPWLSQPSKTCPSPTATRAWDGDAAEKRVRAWADAEDEPNEKYRDAHVWYDADSKDNFTAYKLLIADVVDGRLKAVPRGVMAAAGVMQGARGGVDIPGKDVDRVKSHLAKYYKKMDDTAPWDD